MATETNNDLVIIKSAIEMALRFPPFVEPCQCDGVANQTEFWRDGICGKHQLENALGAIARLEAVEHSVEPTVESGEAIPGVCDEIEELWSE